LTHSCAARYFSGKVLGGYGDAPQMDPSTGQVMTLDGAIRDAADYAQCRARLFHDSVADQEEAGNRGMGRAVRTLMNAEEDRHAGGSGARAGGVRTSGAGPRVTQGQVAQVVNVVKEARRTSRAGVAGHRMAAGQPRMETVIMAATAAPEFRKHFWEVGGACGDAEDANAERDPDQIGGGGGTMRSRGRTPTGAFADDRRVSMSVRGFVV
jgi:hypothetical protein